MNTTPSAAAAPGARASAVRRNGPRQALVACIEDYLNTLLWMSPAAIDEWRTEPVARPCF